MPTLSILPSKFLLCSLTSFPSHHVYSSCPLLQPYGRVSPKGFPTLPHPSLAIPLTLHIGAIEVFWHRKLQNGSYLPENNCSCTCLSRVGRKLTLLCRQHHWVFLPHLLLPHLVTEDTDSCPFRAILPCFKVQRWGQVWEHVSIIPALGRQRHGNSPNSETVNSEDSLDSIASSRSEKCVWQDPVLKTR